MAQHSFFRRFLRDDKGAALVEFAIVSIVFFTLMCGVIEYGLILMTKIAIESAVEQSARSSAISSAGTTGCGNDRVKCIQALIAQKTGGIVDPTSVRISSTVVTACGIPPCASTPPPTIPDVCHNGDPNNPYPATCPPGTPYDDNNSNGHYDANNIDVGNKNDLVQISVFYTWKVMFPLMKPFFANGVYKMSSTTVVKNEPF